MHTTCTSSSASRSSTAGSSSRRSSPAATRSRPTSRSTRRSRAGSGSPRLDAGSVPELVVENPTDEHGAALRRRGARRREAEPHPQRERARRRGREAADPRLLRRAGPLEPAERRVRRREAHLARAPPAPQGRDARRKAARARASRRARSGTRCATKQSRMGVRSDDRREPRHVRGARRPAAALEDAFPLAPGQCGALLALGDALCLDSVSRPEAFARSGRSSAPATCSTPSSGSTGARPRSSGSPAFLAAVGEARSTRGPSAGLGDDVRLRGERDRLRARARRRDAPAVGVHERRRRRAAFGRIAQPSRRR